MRRPIAPNSPLSRLKIAGYVVSAVPFRCGPCQYAGPAVPGLLTLDDRPMHHCKKLDAGVDPDKGCCDLWSNPNEELARA